MFDNNCESFVRWCRTGVAESHQARAAETCMASLTAAALKSCCWPVYATVAKRTVARGLRSGITRLTHYHNGLDRRLTDVQGRVIRELLAG